MRNFIKGLAKIKIYSQIVPVNMQVVYNDNSVLTLVVNISFKLSCIAFGIVKYLEISDDCIISAVKNVENVFQTRRFLSHIVPHIQMHVHLFVQNVVRPFVNRVHCMFTTVPINLKK
jgi:hypothetical protein